MTPGQREWLLAADALEVSLRRPPSVVEVGRALGCGPRAAQSRHRRAVAAGHVVDAPRTMTGPRFVRASPAARIELGLPLLVYLAWPEAMPSGEVADLLVMLARIGAHCVSPLLVPGMFEVPAARAAAQSAAVAAHGVVVWRDRVLLCRADVDAARHAGVPVAVVPRSDALPSSAAELWIPPRLVPAIDPGPSTTYPQPR